MSVCWLQITAGQGPKECAWVVAQLCNVMSKAAIAMRLSLDVIERLAYDKTLRKQNVVMPDAYRSMLIRVEGDKVEQFVNEWCGSIKWQGESLYRPKHKRTNWFVAVVKTAVTNKTVVDLSRLKSEVLMVCMRSTGPGGQHVNKTNSAVRLTHRPTGLQVRVDTDRSQHRNKQIAMERLAMLLMEGVKTEEDRKNRDMWLNHYQVQRGRSVKIFVGKSFEEKLCP